MCRIRRTSEWAYRILLESYYWEHTSFYTFTYDNEHVPIQHEGRIFRDSENRPSYWQKQGAPMTLHPKDMTDFWKKLRKKLKEKKRQIKYYYCGEYGERDGRPHYHAIIFGVRPKYEEQAMADTWGMGAVEGRTFNRERGQYTAGYIQKKLYGDKAAIIQSICDEKGSRTGAIEAKGIQAPFSRMSKGIGLNFALEQKERIEKELNITVNGKNIGLPRYFIKKLDLKEKVRVKSLKRQEKEVGKEEVMRHIAENNMIIPEIAEKELKKARTKEQQKKSLRSIHGETRS